MKPKLIREAGRALTKASPTILTCVGAIGVVATAVLAVKATPKALEMARADSRKNHDGDPYAATKLEMVKSCWKCYVPAAITGTVTVVCIFSANTLNRKQQASLASAYALVSHQYNDYKRKVKELYGAKAHKKIVESFVAEKVDKDHIISAQGIMGNSSLAFEDAVEEERLFYDSFSGRYFTSTISKVLQAEYHLNRNFVLNGGEIPLNHFYDLLGIDDIAEGDAIGWAINDEMCWIDFDHSRAILEDGLECYIIDMVYTPGTVDEYLD
ncbi:hypothetical protein D1159_05955 [Pseudoflavonifractor sp. 524-17]|uniref:DUF6353 family protein n=1 Tax=Pseudoflavonifractor sp. 524-17 TaxID=2304577 RepID=UPI0013797B2E|nr:DUF6353 family protein [Pseudoflavonifractor sp. 524-17]NCE64142.1 hypothetical protein [Pseudoflavonifractor sp. 524-17]